MCIIEKLPPTAFLDNSETTAMLTSWPDRDTRTVAVGTPVHGLHTNTVIDIAIIINHDRIVAPGTMAGDAILTADKPIRNTRNAYSLHHHMYNVVNVYHI